MPLEKMDSENGNQVVQVSEPWVQAQTTAESGSALLSQVLRALTNLPGTNSGAVTVGNLAQLLKSKPMVVGLPNLPTSQASAVSQTHFLIPVSTLSSIRGLEACSAAPSTQSLLLQTNNVPPTPSTSSIPAPLSLLNGVQMSTTVSESNSGLPRGSAVNNVLPAALVNSTTANLIAQLANSVSAGMLTVAQSSLLTHPQDVSSTLTELGQLLTTITSLTSTLHTSLETLINMTSNGSSSGLTNTSTSIPTTTSTSALPSSLPAAAAPLNTGRFITLRVIPSTAGPSNLVNIRPSPVMEPLPTVSLENKSSNSTGEVLATAAVQLQTPSLAVNMAYSNSVMSQLREVSTPLVAVKPAVNIRKRPAPMASEDTVLRHPLKSTTRVSEGATGVTSGSTISSMETAAASSRQLEELNTTRDSSMTVSSSAAEDDDDEATLPATGSPPNLTPEAQKLAAAATSVSNLVRKNIYVCPIEACRKTFMKRSKLRDHLCGHTGERPYVCPLCKARFIRSCDLRRHSSSHLKAHDDPLPDSSPLSSVL